jgi:hypothetical protein
MAQMGFVILYTRDVAKKIAFYERAFGLEKKRVSPRARCTVRCTVTCRCSS